MEALKRFVGGAPSQEGLINRLASRGVVYNRRALATLKSVDRKHFLPRDTASNVVYNDAPVPIGAGQTISAPHMHAIALEILVDWLKPGVKVLDVGSGSGYMSACMALMVRPGGWLLGVEKVPELAIRSVQSIAAASSILEADKSCWCIRTGNVLDEDILSGGPFNAIHVGAAADEVHQELLDVLALGGRMVIPVGPRWGKQVLMVIDKNTAGELRVQELMNVGYVPLVRPSEMEDGYQA